MDERIKKEITISLKRSEWKALENEAKRINDDYDRNHPESLPLNYTLEDIINYIIWKEAHDQMKERSESDGNNQD